LVIQRDVVQKRRLATQIRRALRGVPEAFDILGATPSEIERYGGSPALIFRVGTAGRQDPLRRLSGIRREGNMGNGKSSISQASSHQEIGEFWDNHDL